MSLPGIFVIGTDTGVGKTEVACALIHALQQEGKRVGAIKPVATGAIEREGLLVSEDVEKLQRNLAIEAPSAQLCSILYEEPLAPPVAARRTGKPLTSEFLRSSVHRAVKWWEERVDVLVVEGVGGILCPIAEGTTVADLAVDLDYPILIVARRSLGTLNHTLLTLELARQRGLRIVGLVMNGADPTSNEVAEATNVEELARHVEDLRIFPEIPHGADLHAWAVAKGVGNWYDRSRVSRRSVPTFMSR